MGDDGLLRGSSEELAEAVSVRVDTNDSPDASFNYRSASYASSRFTPAFYTGTHVGTRVAIMATAFMVTIVCAIALMMSARSADNDNAKLTGSPCLYIVVGGVGMIVFAGSVFYHIVKENHRQSNTPISSWVRFNNSLAQESNVSNDSCVERTLLPLTR